MTTNGKAPEIGSFTDFWAELMRMRDADRERKERALRLVEGDKLPVESGSQGLQRWYLHPAADNTVIKSMCMYVQDIPPHSKTGKYLWQGGENVIFVQGSGYSVIDEERLDWEPLDGLLIPLREKGVTVQHFNPNDEPAAFVCVFPNLFGALGIDMGTGFEQIEEAPKTDWSGPCWLGVERKA